MSFGPAPIPSVQTSIFLGGSIPYRTLRAGNWLALGVDGGFALGLADGSLGGNIDGRSLYTFRTHVSVHGVAGANDRLMYAAGLGPLIYLGDPRYQELSYDLNPRGRGIEAEGRIGVVFGRRSPVPVRRGPAGQGD